MKKLFSILGALTILAGAFSAAILIGLFAALITIAYTGDSQIAIYSFLLFTLLTLILPSPNTRGITYIVFTQGLCEKIQTSLIALMGSKAPSLSRTPVGYLEALQSQQNTMGVTKAQVDPGTGKKKQVRIKFIQRGVEDDIVEVDNTKTCVTDLEKEPFEETVEITKFIGTKGMKFNEEEMRKLCEDDSEYMGGIIRAMINPLITKLDKRLLTLQAADFGDFWNTTNAAKTVQLLQGSNQAPRYLGEHEILEFFRDLEVGEKPIVVGAGILSKYVDQVGIGCCNQDGVDLSKAGNLNYYYDKAVESIIGMNHFIGLIPGFVQLLTWNKYVGKYRKENDVFSKGTILDPVTGLVFDMKWHYDDCEEVYSVKFFLNYELYFIPSNAWAVGDPMNGVNGSLHFIATDTAS